MLNELKAAREILDRSFAKWEQDDGKGGHCAFGALSLAFHKRAYCSINDIACLRLLEETARALFPELKGKIGLRLDCFNSYDHFDLSPIVFVNNQLGKEAILKVFDAAILELELRFASVAEEPELEKVGASAAL